MVKEMVEIIFKYFEIVVYTLFAINSAYLFCFALASLFYKPKKYKRSEAVLKFLVLIPAYKEDNVIVNSALSALDQDYPSEKMVVAVVSDRMKSETNLSLEKSGANVIIFEPESSSKAKALNYAFSSYANMDFDVVVILDADNIVENSFIATLNDAFVSGCNAIQAHRTAKNLETEVAVLDAISEEINNSIFRRGHIAMGLSSALIGSGMAFKFNWFKGAVNKLSTAGEDKELEILLLKEGIFIDYLDNLLVFDEKTKKESVYYNQRRRWIAAQFYSLSTALKWLPEAVRSINISYIDKVFQWTMPPRVVLLGLVFLIAGFISIYDINIAIRWALLLFVVVLSLAISVPMKMVRSLSLKSLIKLPKLFLLTILNFFRTKGAVKKFIHTPKN
ncbi:MAG: glycosyltransferase family 2 protein [Bacteroidales bacterium]|jgi:cellulose synthase/poly-beta-1,6-N-acetylglucosamine synthase-like glycosyltransferase|nr:glycosyltransferase family 2 protein [Bacteroidales bacterium]